ncbi:hypothetical protein [Nocardioides sp. InS609-2]|uniref:hypothetical protein n=1 Tax=Nocardioides sp. InS609-2 TaxID=2760705 RepID=UPI0020C0CA3B|nr:hypothetical protein [Nocardioides sp. InS609-2]
MTAPGRLVGRCGMAYSSDLTDEQWALPEPESFENTTTSVTGWLQVACIATTLRTCHVHGLTGVLPAAVCMGVPARNAAREDVVPTMARLERAASPSMCQQTLGVTTR